jgi:hypothetical protein
MTAAIANAGQTVDAVSVGIAIALYNKTLPGDMTVTI